MDDQLEIEVDATLLPSNEKKPIDEKVLAENLIAGITGYISIDYTDSPHDILIGHQDETDICFIYFKGNVEDCDMIQTLLLEKGSRYKKCPVDPV